MFWHLLSLLELLLNLRCIGRASCSTGVCLDPQFIPNFIGYISHLKLSQPTFFLNLEELRLDRCLVKPTDLVNIAN